MLWWKVLTVQDCLQYISKRHLLVTKSVPPDDGVCNREGKGSQTTSAPRLFARPGGGVKLDRLTASMKVATETIPFVDTPN